MIDFALLKPGTRVKVKNPDEVGTVNGSYMSTDGIIVTVKTNLGSIADRNVKLEDIVEVLNAGG